MVVPPFVLDRGFVGGMDFKWTWYYPNPIWRSNPNWVNYNLVPIFFYDFLN